jgi:molybdopterin/thiamine biosynthesis adenylyltransferase
MRGQRELAAATVRVDVDGPATQVALAYLAAAGVGELALGGAIDRLVAPGDVAGAPLLEATDVGRPMLEALADRVAALDPDVAVSAAAGHLDPIDVEPAADPARALVAGGRAAAAAIARICQGGEP